MSRSHPKSAVSAEERRARVALGVISQPADPRVARLVAAMGPVELRDRLLADIDLAGVRSETGERLAAVEPQEILERADADGIRYVVPGDSEWPAGLEDLATVEPLNGLAGVPLGLWVKGPARLDSLCRRSVAVVGSRSATTYGTSAAGDLAAHVGERGVSVVSGAAFGIDQAAHRAALAVDAPTAAVLACGVDRAYPAAHRGLLDYIAEVGAVVSELPPGCAPTRVRFLGRNRLIAALTTGTVIVEAAVRSGALNTANWAGRLGRVVMGVPGPVTSAPSEGVHELVRSGAAVLVTRGEHVLEMVGAAGEHLPATPRGAVRPRDRLDPVDVQVLEAVPLRRAAPAASIARVSGLASAVVLESLARLAGLGWVTAIDDRWRHAEHPPT